MNAYKVLGANGRPHHGGIGQWPLPQGSRPGKWIKVDGTIRPCRNGLHLCCKPDLIHWLGPQIWLAEYRGEVVESKTKIVVREARLLSLMDTWNDRTARLFAADCAARALRLCEKRGLTVDGRSKASVKAARDFANGKITADDLAAARDAARDAAWDAARDAARDAAWDAARDAARDAAWDAARDAARDAAWDAAWAAARAAAWAAAWAAEIAWQTKRLFEYLDGTRGAA